MGYKKVKRAVFAPFLRLNNDVQITQGAAAPTDGTSGTGVGYSGPGSIYIQRSGPTTIYQNTGTKASPSWEPVAGGSAGIIEVRNETGVTLAAGTPVYLSGWSETADKALVAKADANAAGAAAEYFITASLATATNGTATKAYRGTVNGTGSVALDFSGATIGDPVYLGTTAGECVLVDPTAAGAITQIVARVAVVATDIAEAQIHAPQMIGSNELSTGSVTSAKIADGTIVAADIASGANIARSQLITETAFIDLEEKLKAADGADLALSETAGDFFRDPGTNQWLIQGEAAINETEASVGLFSFVLPENYVAGGTITLRASALVTLAGDAANDPTSTIDMTAFLQSKTDGTVGADLVTTAATTLATAGADYDFTVDPSGLVAGDKLVCSITTSVVETAGGTGAANSTITRLGAAIQVKG